MDLEPTTGWMTCPWLCLDIIPRSKANRSAALKLALDLTVSGSLPQSRLLQAHLSLALGSACLKLRNILLASPEMGA